MGFNFANGTKWVNKSTGILRPFDPVLAHVGSCSLSERGYHFVMATVIEPTPALFDFCRRWHVRELSLFGSALRSDYGPKSDVDLLVEFVPDAPVSLWDWGPMLEEPRAIFGRKGDAGPTGASQTPRCGLRAESWVSTRPCSRAVCWVSW